MALDTAQYISQKLTTPVSIGVHRDAPITTFGEAKTGAERGCHAHLYFPTRKLLLDDAASDDEKSGGTGMGEKLSFLSNKSTAGYFIEDVNKLWAEAANRFTGAVGLVADYDHRSYRRQGLKIQPQPRWGEAVTAMQRQGHATRRGAHVLEVKAILVDCDQDALVRGEGDVRGVQEGAEPQAGTSSDAMAHPGRDAGAPGERNAGLAQRRRAVRDGRDRDGWNGYRTVDVKGVKKILE